MNKVTFTLLVASLFAIGGLGGIATAYMHHIDTVKLFQMEQLKEKKQEEVKQEEVKSELAKQEELKQKEAKNELAKQEKLKQEEARQAQKVDDFRKFISKNTVTFESEINNLPKDINNARNAGTIGPAEIVVNDIKRINVLITEAESFTEVPDKYKTYYSRYLATLGEDKKTLQDIQADFLKMPYSYISSKQQHLTDSLDALKQVIHQTKVE